MVDKANREPSPVCLVVSGNSTTVTEYTLHGKNVVHMTQGNNVLHFYYDVQDRPAIVIFNSTAYGYLYNLQGDVVALVDGTGTKVVEYTYDAWGKPTGKTGTMAETLGTVQPFRYRGYVFDEETGYHYLRSRFYNSIRGKFTSPDNYLGIIGELLGSNVYAYCYNSVTNTKDESGHEIRYDCLNCLYLKPGDNFHYHRDNIAIYNTDDYFLAIIIGTNVRVRDANAERTGKTTNPGGTWYARVKKDKYGNITDYMFAEVLDTRGTTRYATLVNIAWSQLMVETKRMGFTQTNNGGTVRIRSTPDLSDDHNILFTVRSGEAAFIIDEIEDFFLISFYDLGSGWIYKKYFYEENNLLE